MSIRNITSGDFTGLAADYSEGRPDYSQHVLNSALGLHEMPVSQLDVVDVGAGTGIWTRMIASMRPRTICAIEPNDDMRARGVVDSSDCNVNIEWMPGTGEQTGLKSQSADWVTMASSFHWVDFEAGTKEFARILRPGGWFTALWNPRVIDRNPLLAEIEDHLAMVCPTLRRKSSGHSGVTVGLTERLEASRRFSSVVYTESHHVVQMSVERYVTAWRSVNDVRVQLGEERFAQFLQFLRSRLENVKFIDAIYLTRAWSARVV